MRLPGHDRTELEPENSLEELEALEKSQFLEYAGPSRGTPKKDVYLTFADGVLRVFARLACAAALALIIGGFGLVLAKSRNGEIGAAWMAFGGFLLGLLVPLPRRRP